MAGDIEIAHCDRCKEKAPVSRTRFYYDIDCECHQGTHVVIARFCDSCLAVEIPKPPLWIQVAIKPIAPNRGDTTPQESGAVTDYGTKE